MKNEKLEHALDLARQGFSVFPLASNEKVPLFKDVNWRKYATQNPEQIRAWWRETPDANIGLVMDGFVAIDIDLRHNGHLSWKEFLEQHELLGHEMVKTRRHKTWSGGAHIIYRQPPGVTIGNSQNQLGPGIDIKATGGYVVGPGSTIDGKPYTVANPNREIGTLPEWLSELCTKSRAKSAAAGKWLFERTEESDAIAIALATAWLDEHAPDANHGTIDNTAFTVAAKFYDFGVPDDEAVLLLAEWSEKHAHPPMEQHDIERVAHSAGKNRALPRGILHPFNASGFEAIEIDETKKSPIESPIKIARFDELAARALDEAGDPLVDGVIDRGAMSTWYGGPKSYKSFIMLNLALMIATGKRWAGRETHKGTVIYAALEGGRGVMKRLHALQKQHPDSDGAPLYVIPKPLNLLKPKDRAELTESCNTVIKEAGQIEFIVIDTVARAMAGNNENAPEVMSAFIQHVDVLRHATKAHVALVHHTGKDPTKGARGHSSLLGALDSEFEIKRGKVTGSGTITATAQRDIEDDVKFRFTRKIVPLGVGKKGKPVTSCTVEIVQAHGQPGADWPKALALFRECLIKAIEAGGVDHQRDKAKPIYVKAVKVDDVREMHRQGYVHPGDGDPKEAERKAWGRARTKALNDKLVAGRGELIWFARDDLSEDE
jgi:hypothetical protein